MKTSLRTDTQLRFTLHFTSIVQQTEAKIELWSLLNEKIKTKKLENKPINLGYKVVISIYLLITNNSIPDLMLVLSRAHML